MNFDELLQKHYDDILRDSAPSMERIRKEIEAKIEKLTGSRLVEMFLSIYGHKLRELGWTVDDVNRLKDLYRD